jgi:hypothetical protein
MKGIKAADRPVEDDPKRIYTEWILLEYSDVPIPSNPEAVNIAVSKGLLSADSAGVYLPGAELAGDDVTDDTVLNIEELDETEIIRRDLVLDDTELKEGRRFSKSTLKALDDVRMAATASSEANQAVIEALDVLVDIPDNEPDEIGEEIDEKDIEESEEVEEEMTPEMATLLLEQDDKEIAAEANKPITAKEKILIATGKYV